MRKIGLFAHKKITVIIFCLSFIIFPIAGNSQNIADRPVRIYQLWDWVSYKNCNYPTSLTEGLEYIYIGTSGGIIAFHKYGRYWADPFTTSNGLSDDFVTAVLFDQTTNYLWAAHHDGVSYLTPASQRWANISKTDLNLPESNTVTRLGTDGNSIWVEATGGYLFTINKILGFSQAMHSSAPSSVVWQPSSYDSVPDIRTYSIDQNCHIDGRGVVLDADLREYPLTLFMKDANQDAYGGIAGLGLFEGDANIKIMRLHPAGPLQNFINALAIDKNHLWMSGSQSDPNPLFTKSGISGIDLRDWNWDYFENILINELATDIVTDLAFRKDRLWVGTAQGLSIYDQKKNDWKRLSMFEGLADEIVTTIALEDSVAWIGTPRGLSVVTIPGYKARRFRLSPGQNILKILKVAIDPKKIWVGTDNGLYSIDKFNRNVEHYDMFGTRVGLDEAVAAEFQAIGIGDSVNVFGRYNGLLRYSQKSETWTSLPLTAELNDADIFDLAVAGNYLWLGTNQGATLMRLNDFYSEHYTTVDGLAGNNVFKVIVDGDWIWFATDRGLTKYQWRKYATFAE